MQLVQTCVNTPMDEVHFLEEMCDKAKQISFKTFRRRVNNDLTISSSAGGSIVGKFGSGIKLENDYAVSFYRSTFKGKPCYYMQWSAIEFIFQ